MDEIQLSSTSARTAEGTPIVVRQTDFVRLVFRPTVLVNDREPRACINGEFVYERKKRGDEWQSATTESLSRLKAGEGYKLALHASELLTLMSTLVPLYKTFWKENNIPSRPTKFVRLESELAQLVTLSQPELEQFLDAHPKDAVAVLGRVLSWLVKRPVTSEIAATLAAVEPGRLPSISALLGVSTMRAALAEWSQNAGNHDEDYWQDMLGRYSFVLSQLFAQPVVVIDDKAYLGGKRVDNSGGSYLDFLMATACTSAVALVEIKTPETYLLGAEYRTDALPPSREVAGAVAQVLKYRSTFVRGFDHLSADDSRRLVLGGCPTFVIVGHTKQLDSTAKRESFERFRSQLRDVNILTFDELFTRVGQTVELLDGPSALP